MLLNKYAIRPGSRVTVKSPMGPLIELVFMQIEKDVLQLFSVLGFNRWNDDWSKLIDRTEGERDELVSLEAIKIAVGSGYTIEEIKV